MRHPGTKKEKNTSDVSFPSGIVFILAVFMLSNLYEAIFNKYLTETFDSTLTIYILSLVIMLVPTLFMALVKRELLNRWAKSMNFGVLLIIVITTATILGTLIFQNRMPQEYIQSYGQFLFSFFVAVHMIDLFHSVWFVNMIFILIVNILYCYISRREFNLKNLGGYILHFGIIVSLLGAFMGFVWGMKGVIQLNEGDEVDTFLLREKAGPPRLPLGYELALDDFSIEWYEPKYLVNTYQMTRGGGELLSSLNVEKKGEVTVGEAGVEFRVLRFSENGVADGIGPSRVAEDELRDGMPPSPIMNLMVENLSLRRMTRDEAKASGWLAAYDDHQNRFTNVFDTDATIQFNWNTPGDLAGILGGKTRKHPDGFEVTHVLTFGIGDVKKSLEVEPEKAYRLEGTPYLLRITGFYPNFKIDNGVPYSASDETENPALSVEITDTEHPDKAYKPTYLFAREELRGMMHEGGLPEGLTLEYTLQGITQTGGTRVYIVGGENRVYIVRGEHVVSESPIEFGSPVSFKASGHDLQFAVQELYRDEPYCELVVRDGAAVDTMVISPLFSDPIRHHEAGYLSTFRRGRDLRDYKRRVRVLANGEEIMAKTIEVSHTLVYGGYTIYQQSYNEVDWTWTGFEVVRDPGLWIVYLGFIMMCIGSIYVFYVRPRIT